MRTGRKSSPVTSRLMAFCLALMVAVFAAASGAQAQTSQAQPTPQTQTEQPPKVKLLLDLLDDSEVQEWVKQQNQGTGETTPVTEQAVSPSLFFANRIRAVAGHISNMLLTLPRLPAEVSKLMRDSDSKTQGYGLFALLLLAIVFTLVGWLAAQAFNRATAGRRLQIDQVVVTGPAQRFRLKVSEFFLVLGSIAAFGLISVMASMVFNLPEPVEKIILQVLSAALTSWAIWNVLTFLLKPTSPDDTDALSEQRIIPLKHASASHFARTLGIAATWFCFGAALHAMLNQLGMNESASQLISYCLGIGLVLIGTYAVLRMPSGAQFTDQVADATTGRRAVSGWLYVVGFVVLWLLWTLDVMRLFWLLAVVMVLPIAIRTSHLAVVSFFKQASVAQGADTEVQSKRSTVWAAVVDRGLRAVLIFGALATVGWGWGLELGELNSNRDVLSITLSGLIKLLTVYLIADLLWQIVRTAIDTTLDNMHDLGEPGMQETVRQAKLRTILPIVRNCAWILLLTLGVMMGLSALGVEIGPLIASAGIVGVAVGFGSQALVKDVISGMFYLFDDAFRIGEYIQAGSFKGTVESFSLRSIRLRHHRGPIYTIPFGDLGAVQNLSRDYVIDKLTFQVAYDTDLEKARKLIKKAGQELAENPEIGPNIISPLKMQRVNNFGEYGIEIMTKMTCIPGGQWEVRPKIYPLIKRKFEENGIEFARPTVKVAGEPADKDAAASAAMINQTRAANETKQ